MLTRWYSRFWTETGYLAHSESIALVPLRSWILYSDLNLLIEYKKSVPAELTVLLEVVWSSARELEADKR